MEAFSGSQTDLECAADNLFSSPPYPVPRTPGTVFQNKIESRLEKSLGNQFNIQLQHQMGVFQASMLEAMKSLQEEMQSMKKASKAEVDKTSASLSKAGPSKLPDPTTTQTSFPTRASDHSDAQPMDTDVYGPPFPSKFTQSVQSDPASKNSLHSDKKKTQGSQSSSSEEHQSSVPSEPEHQQNSTDPVFYREVDMSDIPS